MVPTKQTVTTWSSLWFTAPEYAAAAAERTAFLETMVAADKTPTSELLGNTSVVNDDPTQFSFRRPWVSQESAQEWSDFLATLSAKYSLPFVSSVVSDYTPSV